MMSFTHCVLGVTATSLLLGTADPLVLMGAAIASQLPDVDTSKSVPGRVLFPFSHYLEKRYPHRSVTHSFMATAIFAAIALPVALLGLPFYLSLISGYFWGWFGDVFTKSGVCAFYPSQIRCVCPGNPRLRLSTNSPAEFFVLGVLVLVAIGSINANSNGGIVQSFTQTLGLPEGAIEIINREGSRYLLYAQVEGRNTITQGQVNQQFEVVEALTQSDFLGKDGEKLYRIGQTQDCQIVPHTVRITRSRPIRSQVKEVQLEEQTVADVLSPAPRTYITGNLQIPDAEDLIIPSRQDRFNTIRLQPLQGGAAIAYLEAASPEDVLEALGEYEGSGSLVIRSVEVL